MAERRSFDQDRLIRHNLDRFLASKEGLPLLERGFWSAPLFPLTVAFIAGIVLQNWLCLSAAAGISVAAFSLLFFLSVFFVPHHSYRAVYLYMGAAVVVFIAAGMLRYAAFITPEPDAITRLAGTERRLATLEGVIISPIHQEDRKGWAFAEYFPTPPQSSFYLSLHSLAAPNGSKTASGVIRVQVAQTVRHLRQGDRVRLYCWLSPFESAANPGQFDMRAYMHQRGVRLGASVPAAEAVEVLARGQNSFLSTLSLRLKAYTGGALFEDTDYPAESTALAAALLLGERRSLDVKTYAAFQRTGLAHFISLSGMHVGILAGSLWGLSRFLGLPKPMRALVCLILLLIYGLIVPPRAPTVRAVFLSCFFFSAVMLNRQACPLNTLSLSAMVLLMFRPADLFSASWQLSFGTVLGILLLYEPVYQSLMSWTVFKAVEMLPGRFIERSGIQLFLKAGEWGIKMLSVGCSAWLGGAGFLLYHFYSINPLSSFYTVLTMPLVLVILYAGYLKIALASCFPTASLFFGLLLDFGCRGFSAVVSGFAKVPLSEILIGYTPAIIIAAGYVVLLVMRFAPRRVATLSGFLLLILLWFNSARNNCNDLTITCLSVGNGQAVCLSFPDRTQWLIDAGSISQKDPGGRTVLPYLRYQGAASLDTALLTHGDMDHLNGLPEIVSAVPTRGIFANAGVFQKAERSSSASYLKQRLTEAGVPLQPIDELDKTPKGIDIKMLWPDAETAQNMAIEDNDKSQVVRIEYAGRGILLCGDIGQYAQQEIMTRHPSLKADVIVLPHHGSTTNLNTDFIQAIDPKIVIASCAAGRERNAFVPQTDSGIESFYTPTDGAVTLKTKADGTLYAIGFKSQKTIRLD